MVEILRLAADIDHAVDQAEAAEHTAARIKHRAAIDARIRLGGVTPGQDGVIEQFDIAGRDMDQRIAVARPGLDQEHAGIRIGAQPVREHAAGRAGPDDDEIRLHATPPFGRVWPGWINAMRPSTARFARAQDEVDPSIASTMYL